MKDLKRKVKIINSIETENNISKTAIRETSREQTEQCYQQKRQRQNKTTISYACMAEQSEHGL